MQKKQGALILILIGMIVLAFPIIGLFPFSLITGLIISIVGVGLLLGGIVEIGESFGLGISGIILGIIALILGIGFIINPALFSFVASLLVFIAGFILLGIGIVTITGKFGEDKSSGVVSLILGIIYLIIATLVSDPAILGTLIGLWILITGFLILFQKE
ncbi:MAG: DUF308 domain-containing protein [Methanobacteriaceae archaeon]|nr:DUF308 domain-containing protein [Methanobacteriaceae archaeon]